LASHRWRAQGRSAFRRLNACRDRPDETLTSGAGGDRPNGWAMGRPITISRSLTGGSCTTSGLTKSLSAGEPASRGAGRCAHGDIGTGCAAHSEPDGSIFLLTTGAHAVSPSPHDKLPDDWFKEFVRHTGARFPAHQGWHPQSPGADLSFALSRAARCPNRGRGRTSRFACHGSNPQGCVLIVTVGCELLDLRRIAMPQGVVYGVPFPVWAGG
jgi:hypothetical protein